MGNKVSDTFTDDEFMIPFLCRDAAIEDLTIVHDQLWTCHTNMLQWDQVFGALHSLWKPMIEQLGDGVDFSIWAIFQSLLNFALRVLQLSYPVFGEDPWGEEEGGDGGQLVGKLVDYCVERNQGGCRLQRLVVEASSGAPPGLASLSVPCVDHVEIRGEVSDDEHPWDLEFKSRELFYSLRSS